MHINEEPKDALLRHFQEEIARLRKQLEEGCFEPSESEEVSESESSDISIEAGDEEVTNGQVKKPKKKKNSEKSDAEKEALEKKAKERERELDRAK